MNLKIRLWPTLKRQLLMLTLVFIAACAAATVAQAQDGRSGDVGLPDDYYETMWTPGPQFRGMDRQRLALPVYFNWADQGMVTPAKDQGRCNSCWAFAAVGSFESKLLMMGSGSHDLSEQQQISCNLDMNGCVGGSMKALQFWENQGPMRESCTDYGSFWGGYQDCVSLIQCSTLAYNSTGYYTVNTASRDAIKASLYNDGPTYFRYDVYSDFDEFWSNGQEGVYVHSSGIFEFGHAVLIIGWDDDRKAWLCKNSWGETAGPNGDGTFWMAYDGHAQNLNFGMANINIVRLPPSAPTGLRIGPPLQSPPNNLNLSIP